MLVLSRKPEQEFQFRQLGITVRVLEVRGQRVRLGIDAPEDIAVLRGELPDDGTTHPASALGRLDRHELRNQLNTIKLNLHLAQRRFDLEDIAAAQSGLRESLHELTRLEARIAGIAADAEERTGEGLQVLLVEDDPNELRLLAGILELEGYRVTTARDGEEALERLQSIEPDFVLLDMRMPRRDGAGTVRWIREHESLSRLTVFSVSGTSPESYGIPIGPGGVDRWFPKPLDPSSLIGALRKTTSTAV